MPMNLNKKFTNLNTAPNASLNIGSNRKIKISVLLVEGQIQSPIFFSSIVSGLFMLVRAMKEVEGWRRTWRLYLMFCYLCFVSIS